MGSLSRALARYGPYVVPGAGHAVQDVLQLGDRHAVLSQVDAFERNNTVANALHEALDTLLGSQYLDHHPISIGEYKAKIFSTAAGVDLRHQRDPRHRERGHHADAAQPEAASRARRTSGPGGRGSGGPLPCFLRRLD